MKKKVEDGDLIAVWFSCGAASAVASKKILEKYPNCDIRILNSPVWEEHEDNRRFLNDVSEWIGKDIEFVTNDKFPSNKCEDVWEKEQYMAGIDGARCTKELKKVPRQKWENENKPDWHVLGFTVNERERYERFIKTERENVIPILIDEKITKGMCYKILIKAGLTLPKMYRLGYPNANCIGCVKATSATYWDHVRKVHPEVFQKRAEQSRKLNVKLVKYKGKRIFLDELPEGAKGNKMKNMDVECGVFCEEHGYKEED